MAISDIFKLASSSTGVAASSSTQTTSPSSVEDLTVSLLAVTAKVTAALASGPTTDTFSPSNPLFMGSLGQPPPVRPASTGEPIGTLPITKDAQNGTAKVSQALAQIAADPEGQKLIQKAQQSGVRIEIGNEPGEDGAAAFTQGKRVVVDINEKGNSAYNLTATVAHELVHATTGGNGNSLLEETLSTTVGNRIAKRADNKPATPAEELADFNKIYAAYKQAYKGDRSVNGRLDNGIITDLERLGIDVQQYAGRV